MIKNNKMKDINPVSRWVSKNFSNLLMFAILFSLSSTPTSNNKEVALQETVCELENQVNAMSLAMLEVTKTINDPFSLAKRYKQDVVAYKNFVKEERMYPLTKFKLQSYIKNADISTPMLAALIAYSRIESAPQDVLYVNSATRHGNPFSKHCSGNAIDIHFESSKLFLNWLDSTEGRDWILQYQLQFYIEDNHSGSLFLVPWRLRLGHYIFVNPKATGPHVHLQYVGKN